MPDWAAKGIRYAARTPYFPEDLNNYPPWVRAYGLLEPYGQCQCGCGGLTGGKRCLQCHKASRQTIDELFWNHVVMDDSDPDLCWKWNGKIHTRGYGIFTFRGKEQYAHRHSLSLHNGSIPDGLQALHKCDNPPCCNPRHLYAGTHLNNMADMVSRGRNVRGEDVGTAKLTAESVAQVKLLLSVKGRSRRSIGLLYGVSETAIRKIANGDSWAHVIAATERVDSE